MKKIFKLSVFGTSLVVQWLNLCASTARGVGSIPVQGTKIHMPYSAAKKQNKTKQNPFLILCFYNKGEQKKVVGIHVGIQKVIHLTTQFGRL